jgi:subtilisin family serine protease
MITLALLVFSSGTTPVGAQDQTSALGPTDLVPLMVTFKDGLGGINTISLEGMDTHIKHVYHLIPAVALSVPAEGADEAIDALERDPRVDRVEKDLIYQIASGPTPDDPRYANLWGLNNSGQTGGSPDADIDAPEAWNITTDSSSSIIAVVDDGVDINHPDLAANTWVNLAECPGGFGTCIENGIDEDSNGYIDDFYGWDFWNDDNTVFDPSDGDYHGTHVTGTIAASGNNSVGVTGVNWQARVMALKFLGPYGGYTSDAIAAIEYATDKGAVVINASWGGGGFSQSLKDAIEACGCVFAAAAGNSGRDNDGRNHYPSSYDSANLISVGATDHNDEPAYFSNFGATSVDIGAPGVNILSTLPDNAYGSLNGTSMATPHVAGVAGLLSADAPSLTPVQVKDRLLLGADPVPALSGRWVTGGRLNAFESLLGPGLGLPQSSSSTISDASRNSAAFRRVSTVTLGQTAALGFPRTSRSTIIDSDRQSVTFARSSASGFADGSEGKVGLSRTSTTAAADYYGLGFPGLSSFTLGDISRYDLYFDRAETGTIRDTGEVFSMGTSMPEGWSTFSVPVPIKNNLFFASSGIESRFQNGLFDPSKVSVAFKFDAENQTWSQILKGDTVSPMDGVMLKSIEPHTATLILDFSSSTAPAMPLYPRWNLAGPSTVLGSTIKPADQVLSSVLDTPIGEPGYTQVVGPSMHPDSFTWDRGQPSPPDLKRWRAYWISMDNAATLIGESTSPAQ